jgi:hypothetical protein
MRLFQNDERPEKQNEKNERKREEKVNNTLHIHFDQTLGKLVYHSS